MADGVPSEVLKPKPEASQQNSKANEFVRWLKRLGRAHNPARPENDSVSPEEPPKSVNELLGVKEANELRIAPRLLFHTAPSSALEKIKRQGLYSQTEDPNLGNNLGYSTFFAAEHHLRKTGKRMPITKVRTTASPDYVLTIWQKSKYAKKDEGYKGEGFYQATMEPQPEAIPEDYISTAIEGNPTYSFFGPMARELISKEARKIPPEYFAGSIKLDQSGRDQIISIMINAERGIYDADQIEDLFTLQSISQETAQGMAANIEQVLIRSSVMGQIKKIKERFGDQEQVADTLLQTMFLRTKVNDRVSAVYLDQSLKWLTGKLDSMGVNTKSLIKEFAAKVKEFNNDPKKAPQVIKLADKSNFYGWADGIYISQEIKKELALVP